MNMGAGRICAWLSVQRTMLWLAPGARELCTSGPAQTICVRSGARMHSRRQCRRHATETVRMRFRARSAGRTDLRAFRQRQWVMRSVAIGRRRGSRRRLVASVRHAWLPAVWGCDASSSGLSVSESYAAMPSALDHANGLLSSANGAE